jgi:hypothetical protein
MVARGYVSSVDACLLCALSETIAEKKNFRAVLAVVNYGSRGQHSMRLSDFGVAYSYNIAEPGNFLPLAHGSSTYLR